MMTSTPALVVRDLSHRVMSGGEFLPILQHINFRLEAGKSLAIVGRSGSGKSTLLGLLAGLEQASHGEIELLGARLDQLDEDGRAAVRAGGVGFVFQNFQLLGGMSALENVMLPLELAGKNDATAQAHHWLEQVGLAQRLHHLPRKLSGGEQQRVALARAFATRPRIIFADEPTGSLDKRTGEDITRLLFGLNQEQATTLVLVTHDPSLAARCQHQLHLEGGRVEHFA
jgi:putative ABC transport system ATP-binding protein